MYRYPIMHTCINIYIYSNIYIYITYILLLCLSLSDLVWRLPECWCWQMWQWRGPIFGGGKEEECGAHSEYLQGIGNVSKGNGNLDQPSGTPRWSSRSEQAICANSQPSGTPRWCSNPKLESCEVVDKTTALNQNGCRAVCIRTCLWAQELLHVHLMIPVNAK